jgi:hypothetical protein
MWEGSSSLDTLTSGPRRQHDFCPPLSVSEAAVELRRPTGEADAWPSGHRRGGGQAGGCAGEAAIGESWSWRWPTLELDLQPAAA